MIETERSEYRTVQLAFGDAAKLLETAGVPGHPGRVEIHLRGGMIGSGKTFAGALADALSFSLPGVHRASDIPTTF